MRRVRASKRIAVIGFFALLATAACGNNAANNAATSAGSSAATSAGSSAASSASPSAAGSSSAAASSSAGGSSSAVASGSSAGSASATSGGAGGAGSGAPTKNPATDGQTINVLMVNNPQMVDLQKLTADNFTAQTGIKVNYTVLPENDMRNKAALEFKNQAGQYDVATLSNFEIPIYAKNGWLTSTAADYVDKDTALRPVGHLHGDDRSRCPRTDRSTVSRSTASRRS